MSLQLPWAVAFIAEGIGRDVNKVVGWGEITSLAKTKGKEANMERGQRRREARGDSQPINTHDCQMPHMWKKAVFPFPFNIDMSDFIYFHTAYPLSLFQKLKVQKLPKVTG